jgi:YD repeat-containing protein
MVRRLVIGGTVAALLMTASTPSMAGPEYFYDSAGRLIRVVYSNGVTINYRYDAAGNRQQIAVQRSANRPPVALNDSASVALGASVDINVTANDSDPDGHAVTVTAASGLTGGGSVAVISGDTVRYTASGGAGTKTFSYAVSDGRGGSSSATVTVSVTTVNQGPTSVADVFSATAGMSMLLPVLANDTDPDGDPLTITAHTTPTGGAASISGANIIYTAPATQGIYTFSYSVSDGRGGTASAQVTVEVWPGEMEGCTTLPSGQVVCD